MFVNEKILNSKNITNHVKAIKITKMTIYDSDDFFSVKTFTRELIIVVNFALR